MSEKDMNSQLTSEIIELTAKCDELERALCVIGVVGIIDGYDVIRRDSVIEIVRACKENL